MPKPGDHPDFFRFPAPEGRSRESNIRLDAVGRFWVAGEPIVHERMQQAFSRWITRHPDSGRYVLSNGYDWTYLDVEDAPFFVRGVEQRDTALVLKLSDGTEEALTALHALSQGDGGAVYCRVKMGQYPARFTPHAQSGLAPWLQETQSGFELSWPGGRIPIGADSASV